MDFSKHEQLFSHFRLRRYLTACSGDADRAVKLYRANIQLSQAYYPLISVLEVALRNAIDIQVSKFFLDNDWLITQRANFANHPAMVYKDKWGNKQPDHFFSEKIYGAEQKLRYRGVNLTHGKLLAELMFGFWVKFFDSSPIKILLAAPLKAFKNPPPLPAKAIHSHLTTILNLRNRISHSEPICFDKKGNLCLSTMQSYENDICTALEWLDTDLRKWTNNINFVKPILLRAQAI
jgi:hypothetical protein